jgi:hypothetical protein
LGASILGRDVLDRRKRLIPFGNSIGDRRHDNKRTIAAP